MNHQPGPDPLWLYRHGPLDTAPDVCIGWLDVPLRDPEQTAREARRLAGIIGRTGGGIAGGVFASDLLRTRQTATPLAEALGVPLVLDPNLREMYFGEWEGKRWSELQEVDGERFSRFIADWEQTAPPGGESFDDLRRRLAFFWRKACICRPEGSLVIVSHGGALAALATLVSGWSTTYAMRHMIERGHYGLIDRRRDAYAWNFDPARL